MNRHKGFTLVEILIAIAILAVVVSATLAITAGIANVNRNASEHQEDVVRIKAFVESVKETWRDESMFEAGSTANTPALPTECTANSVLEGDLRTLTVTCGDEGAFSLAVARP